MKVKSINIQIQSFLTLSKNDILPIINQLISNGFMINKYGWSCTKPENIFSGNNEDLVGYATNNGVLALKGDDFCLELSFNSQYSKPHLYSLKLKTNKRITNKFILDIALSLFDLLKSCYLYIYQNNSIYYTPGRNIKDCLGGFTALNIFGIPYYNMWGENNIKNAPADKIEIFQNKSFMIQLCNDLTVLDNDIEEKNENLKRHFGHKYFYNKELEFKRTTFDSLKDIVDYQVKKDTNNKYISPDFKKYYNYMDSDLTKIADYTVK